MAAAAILVALTTLSCNRNDGVPFEGQMHAVQKAVPSEARLISAVAAKRTGQNTEASWQYLFPATPNATKQAFLRTVPGGYKLVREEGLEFTSAKYDGHDTFSINFRFRSGEDGSTTVSVVLKSMPD